MNTNEQFCLPCRRCRREGYWLVIFGIIRLVKSVTRIKSIGLFRLSEPGKPIEGLRYIGAAARRQKVLAGLPPKAKSVGEL